VDRTTEPALHNKGISHASIACMRVTRKPSHLAAENQPL
jgi:hypothetical protein